jgi:hypothetical protein
LVQGELAVNVADKRLYTEDSVGGIVELGTNPSSLTVSGNIDVDGTTNLDVVDIDGAVDMASTLTVAGEITANGGVALGDNDKATFGASDDLEIYHSGSHSFISDVGTGNLYLQAADSIILRTAGVNISATFTPTAGVDLNYTGSTKLATTSTGIDVTGTATMDGLNLFDGLAVFKNVDASPVRLISGTVGDKEALTFERNGGAVKGSIEYQQSPIGFNIGTDTGHDFRLKTGGTQRLNLAANGDISFYEDTGTTAKLFWDASAEYLSVGSTTGTFAPINYIGSNGRLGINNGNTAGGTKIQSFAATNANGYLAFEGWDKEYMRISSSGSVGIGTSSPSSKLHITSNATGDFITLKHTSGPESYIQHSSIGSLILSADGTNTGASSRIEFKVDNTERMRISSDGSCLLHNSINGHGLYIAQDNAGFGYHTRLTFQGSNGSGGVNTIAGLKAYQETNGTNGYLRSCWWVEPLLPFLILE